ncbi:OLC1v1003096C1 [Oldenlandia corymbosa var. corymbosa]|uniref:OLC1v1003096C1 n=1 Tax=Oldenlandia corymbosa var. corymbosa TaxID=529605 RepID=A0AAV1DC42_OLDCO|nr:OLC1v1003096C1 [Oldenlandia corymbosa var. corymbosa]
MSAQMRKLSSSMEVKLDANVIHEIFRDRPNDTSRMSQVVSSVELCEGQWGKPGSVVRWNFFTPDGKKLTSKERVEVVDDANKSSTWRVLEGDVKAVYSNFAFIVKVDKAGENKSVVTWTMEYEKQDESTPEPNGLLEACLRLTKDMEAYHLNK